MSGRAPSVIAMRRIQVELCFSCICILVQVSDEAEVALQSELNDWLLHPPEGCALIQYEPLLTWVITMTGPDSASGMPQLYVGENFR